MNGLLAAGRATIAPLEENGKAVATVVARGDEVDLITHGLPVNDRSDHLRAVGHGRERCAVARNVRRHELHRWT